MLTDAALVDLFLQAQRVERALRAEQDGGTSERDDVRDALRHATVTRKSLEGWLAKRKMREASRQTM